MIARPFSEIYDAACDLNHPAPNLQAFSHFFEFSAVKISEKIPAAG
jgi:hypothetical protein